MEDARVAPHIVEVNLQGLTGIVVERFLCRDVNHSPSSPSPPFEMKAVVAVGSPSGGATFGVSAVSSPLKRSPVKEGIAGRVSGKQRFLALWKKEEIEPTPHIVFETDLPAELSNETVEGRTKVKSKEFELRILLTDGTATIPIATATLDVRSGFRPKDLKLVLHPSSLSGSGDTGPKCIYSVDPTSSRLQADVLVREKSELLRGAWGSRAPPYQIQRFVSRAEDAIEVVGDNSSFRTQDVLCLDSEPALTVVSLSNSVSTNAASIASLRRSLVEEKKEDLPEASDDSCCVDEESVEIQEEATFKVANIHAVRSNEIYTFRTDVPSSSSMLDSFSSVKSKPNLSPSRPPKPPNSRKLSQRNPPPPPPPPPSTPPPKKRSSPSIRASPASNSGYASPQGSQHVIHPKEVNVPPSSPSGVEADRSTSLMLDGDSRVELAKVEAESKVSSGSGASGSSAGLLSFKPHLVARLNQLHASSSKGKLASSQEKNKLRLKPRKLQVSAANLGEGAAEFDHLKSTLEASLDEKKDHEQTTVELPRDLEGANPSANRGDAQNCNAYNLQPQKHEDHELHVPIWSERWDDDASTKQSEEETCTYYTRHTAATLQSHWGKYEKMLSMIPWSQIDNLIDRIPIGKLSFLRFASPAEFEDETFDNASLCPNSTLDTMTDEGSLTVYRRSDSYMEDEKSDRFATLGCWLPTANTFEPAHRSKDNRNLSTYSKFDLPDYETVDETSTVDYASITSASLKEAQQVTGSARPFQPKPAAYDLESLEAMSESEHSAYFTGNQNATLAFKQAEPFTREQRQDLAEQPSQSTRTPDRIDAAPRPNEQPSDWSPPRGHSLRRSVPSATDSSPVAVNDFPVTPPRFGETKRHIVSITDFFRRDRIDEESLIDAPSQPEIFVVDDGQSLGDLTLTTHEMMVELNHPVRQNDQCGHQIGRSTSTHADSNERQSRFRPGTGFLSIFSCAAPDGLCAPSSSVPHDTESLTAKSLPVKVHESSRKTQDSRCCDSLAPREDLNLVALDESVQPEMRAAAEAAWLKRMAELERVRPSRKGFEV